MKPQETKSALKPYFKEFRYEIDGIDYAITIDNSKTMLYKHFDKILIARLDASGKVDRGCTTLEGMEILGKLGVEYTLD